MAHSIARSPFRHFLLLEPDSRSARSRTEATTKVPVPEESPYSTFPADNDELPIRAFDFFAFPVPLRDLSTYDEGGMQKRHLRHECERAILKAMETYARIPVGSLQGRIESRKSHEPLLLPPVNFHLSDERLKRAFCELMRGTRAWGNTMPETIVAETYDNEKLPDFLRPQEHQVIFKDARGVVYPCSRASEMHGVQGIDPDADAPILREILRSTYRFGTSLPQGFHHDAQFEYGRHFDNTRFDCSQKGECYVSREHLSQRLRESGTVARK